MEVAIVEEVMSVAGSERRWAKVRSRVVGEAVVVGEVTEGAAGRAMAVAVLEAAVTVAAMVAAATRLEVAAVKTVEMLLVVRVAEMMVVVERVVTVRAAVLAVREVREAAGEAPKEVLMAVWTVVTPVGYVEALVVEEGVAVALAVTAQRVVELVVKAGKVAVLREAEKDVESMEAVVTVAAMAGAAEVALASATAVMTVAVTEALMAEAVPTAENKAVVTSRAVMAAVRALVVILAATAAATVLPCGLPIARALAC